MSQRINAGAILATHINVANFYFEYLRCTVEPDLKTTYI